MNIIAVVVIVAPRILAIVIVRMASFKVGRFAKGSSTFGRALAFGRVGLGLRLRFGFAGLVRLGGVMLALLVLRVMLGTFDDASRAARTAATVLLLVLAVVMTILLSVASTGTAVMRRARIAIVRSLGEVEIFQVTFDVNLD